MIPTLKLQNRALNGDIVAVGVLPKAQWLKNYKSMGPAIDNDDSDEPVSENSDDEGEKKVTPLMQ